MIAALPQVALANDERVLVEDGYCNSREVYTAQGKWQCESVLPSTAAELLRNSQSIVVQGTHLSAACCWRQCHQDCCCCTGGCGE